ncbi:MAG: BamA/TamA family outer membrane protein [Bacteroidota bacterium]
MSDENNILTNATWRKLAFFASWLLLFSCNTTKYLQEDEAFLEKNEIKFVSAKKVKKRKKLAADLLSIVKQKPNTKFLMINRRWFYYKSKKKQREKERKARRIIAELPSIYNEALATETAKSMEFLLAQKGYYNAEVTFETKIKRKQAEVTYLVQPKALFTVDTIRFISKDTAIQQILNQISSATLFQAGVSVSNQLYEEEKQRIRTHLRNVGYRNFYANYFDQLATQTDSSKTKQLALSLEVFPIDDSTFHQTYEIGEVYVYPNYNPQQNLSTLKDTLIDGFHFRIPTNKTMEVRPDVISDRIFLKKGMVYSQKNYDRTIRNLGELGIFKFANIDEKVSTDSTALIDFTIFLPVNQRRSVGGNIEYKNTSFSTLSSDNLHGIETSLSYQDKNALGGSELFNANFRFGIQFGRTGDENLINTFDISPQFDLNIPKFRDVFGFVRLMNGIGIFRDQFYQNLLENANTRLSLGVNWSQRRGFWGYFSTDLSLGYEIQTSPNRRYFVKQLGLNIFRPTVEGAGAEIFAENPFLERTFNRDQLFTGLLIRDFGFSFAGQNPNKNSSWRLFLNTEVSGFEAMTINWLSNISNTEERENLQLLGLDFAQFGRLDIDGRYYKYFRPTRSLALRLNTGIAFPFGTSNDVPYVKQFFAGGPNSIRAWRVRELGPGSYRDPSTFPSYTENQTPFYQTGDFKFIFSAEYRFLFFKLYGFDWEGALFLDGGNIWTLREDPDRPGSGLTTRFWRQIALGTGAGLRIDFDYFLLRLDLGYKLRNPYPNPQGDYWAGQEFRELGFRGINYNLGVGYAF